MSGKLSKWKELKSTGERLNQILNIKPNDLPTKFAPKRDRSESVDKLFNNSRSRVHSVELTALNKTRQQQFLDPKKNTFQTQRKDQLEKKTSAVYPNLMLGERQSTQIFEGSQYLPARPSLLISEIKKEYQTFKKNVLAQLQRQRQMVQKMLKEIILTFQYELQKLTRHQNAVLGQIVIPSVKEDQKIKSIEDWKSKLASVTIVDSKVTQKVPDLKQSATLKQELLRPSKQKKQELSPPKLPLNLDAFLGNLGSLKRQLENMDRIFDRHQQVTNGKVTKK